MLPSSGTTVKVRVIYARLFASRRHRIFIVHLFDDYCRSEQCLQSEGEHDDEKFTRIFISFMRNDWRSSAIAFDSSRISRAKDGARLLSESAHYDK